MDASRIEQVLAAAGLAAETPGVVVDHGKSGDLVARCGEVFVKLARRAEAWNARTLARETEVLLWLAGQAPVPAVLWSGDCGEDLALVMAAAPGTPVSHVGEDPAEAALTAALRTLAALHALPLGDCPFDQRLAVKLAQAEARLAAGLVDETDFDAQRLGLTAAEVWAQLTPMTPAGEDLVMTHGDASLPNFIWDGGAGTTLIDLGRFGIADRHQDLALFLRSARRNHPHVDAVRLLQAHYPLARLDEARLAFYRLLDEFF